MMQHRPLPPHSQYPLDYYLFLVSSLVCANRFPCPHSSGTNDTHTHTFPSHHPILLHTNTHKDFEKHKGLSSPYLATRFDTRVAGCYGMDPLVSNTRVARAVPTIHRRWYPPHSVLAAGAPEVVLLNKSSSPVRLSMSSTCRPMPMAPPKASHLLGTGADAGHRALTLVPLTMSVKCRQFQSEHNHWHTKKKNVTKDEWLGDV